MTFRALKDSAFRLFGLLARHPAWAASSSWPAAALPDVGGFGDGIDLCFKGGQVDMSDR
jgi:hypothetical protein